MSILTLLGPPEPLQNSRNSVVFAPKTPPELEESMGSESPGGLQNSRNNVFFGA